MIQMALMKLESSGFLQRKQTQFIHEAHLLKARAK